MTPEIVNGCELYCGDCLDILPALADGCADAIITDLPYGTTACKWDEVIPFAPMWEQVKRLLKKRGAFVTTASQPFTSKLVMSNAGWFKEEWVWNKVKPSGFMTAKYKPMMQHENILVFCGGIYNPQMTKRDKIKRSTAYTKSDSNPIGRPDMVMREYTEKYPKTILEYSNATQTGKSHPTQKPVALYEYLIRTYTNAGDVVLDFCFGSGTTGVAAIQTGRKFIGIERERKYYKIAEKRIAQAQAPLLVPVGEKLELTL